MSDPFRLHGLLHTGPLCLPLSPRVCSNSCPLSQWCYLTVSSSAALFSFCLHSFPASGSFSLSQLFTSGGQSIGVSASVLVLPMNIQIFNTYLLSNYYVKYWSKPQRQKSDQSRWSLPSHGVLDIPKRLTFSECLLQTGSGFLSFVPLRFWSRSFSALSGGGGAGGGCCPTLWIVQQHPWSLPARCLHHHSVVITENISRHCHVSPGGRLDSDENHWSKQFSECVTHLT